MLLSISNLNSLKHHSLIAMARIVRSSKFRHVFGTDFKRDKCYDGIRITKAPHESNMCSVNGKFFAVVLEAQGGGAFMVAPLTAVSIHMYSSITNLIGTSCTCTYICI